MRALKLLPVALLVLLVVGCSKPQEPFEGGVLQDEQKPVSAEAWVRTACRVLGEAEKVHSAGLAPDSEPDVEEEDGRASLRDELADDFEERQDRLNDLVGELHEAGVPTSTGGTARAQSLERALVDLAETYGRASRTVGSVDTGDLEEFQAGLQRVLGSLESGSVAMSEARDGLFNDSALVELLAATPACKGR